MGIHGIPREREWDAVASAEAPGLPPVTTSSSSSLADGSLVVDEDVPDGTLAPLADALSLSPPVPRLRACTRTRTSGASAAKRVQVVEVPEDVPGDEIQLVGQRRDEDAGSSTTTGPSASIPSLEAFAAEQFGSFVTPREPPDDLALGGHGHPALTRYPRNDAG